MRLLGLLLLVSTQAAPAQTDFFFSPPGDFSPMPPRDVRAVEAEYPIVIDIRALAEAPDAFRVELPTGSPQVFSMQDFEPKEGFVLDGLTPVPDPNASDADLVYSWFGTSSEGSSLSFSVYGGHISATLITDTRHYAIAERKGQLVFRQMDPADVEIDSSEFDGEKAFSFTDIDPRLTAKASALDFIDVLVLHTPDALATVGSRGQLNALIAESIDQANLTIRNSGVVSFRYVNALDGANLSIGINYNEQNNNVCGPRVPAVSCLYAGHREFLRNSFAAQTLRNTHEADLVVMFIAGNLDVGPTGVAYTQRPGCGNNPDLGEDVDGCGVGAAYNDFAYSVVSADFATSFQVFAHETGHQLGMEHHPAAGSSDPSFPWSYGHFVSGVNETVMSTSNQAPRALQFSNPDVPFIGTTVPSGTILRWNARTGAALATGVSEFRDPQLLDLIFRSGFEALPIDL